jgi:hypothetical protein
MVFGLRLGSRFSIELKGIRQGSTTRNIPPLTKLASLPLPFDNAPLFSI